MNKKYIFIILGIFIILFLIIIYNKKSPNHNTIINQNISFDFEQRTFILGTIPLPKSFFNENDIENAYTLTKKIGEYVSLSHNLGWNNDKELKKYRNEVNYAKKNNLNVIISIYLFLGIELNGYYKHNPKDFKNFVTLYKETYDLIKTKYPNTKISVTFLYESLYLENQWDAITAFGDKLDVVGFTTYPSFYYDSFEKIPKNYYSNSYKYIPKKPIMFMEVGWPGDDENKQAQFINQFFKHTKNLKIEGFFWTLLHDWNFGGPFKTMGMINSKGRKKPVFYTLKKLKDIPFKNFK